MIFFNNYDIFASGGPGNIPGLHIAIMEIIRLDGIDKKLYELVAPLAMNPAVLRQNNNYPFKTSFKYVWYIALEGTEVIGFMPLKPSSGGKCIDNYYIQDDSGNTIDKLLEHVIDDHGDSGLLSALVHRRHVQDFHRNGFRTFIEWTKYEKMDYIFAGRR